MLTFPSFTFLTINLKSISVISEQVKRGDSKLSCMAVIIIHYRSAGEVYIVISHFMYT